jgi:hypothetical protein
MRGKRRRAYRTIETSLTEAARAPVDARLAEATAAAIRVPVGPVCPWCKTPVEQCADGSQSRCGCGLP